MRIPRTLIARMEAAPCVRCQERILVHGSLPPQMLPLPLQLSVGMATLVKVISADRGFELRRYAPATGGG